MPTLSHPNPVIRKLTNKIARTEQEMTAEVERYERSRPKVVADEMADRQRRSAHEREMGRLARKLNAANERLCAREEALKKKK